MKVKVVSTFVGSPAELEEYGGQVPDSMKKVEKKLSQAERDSFRGKITAGTVMEVSDKRAHELAALGVIEEKIAKKEEAAPAKKSVTKK